MTLFLCQCTEQPTTQAYLPSNPVPMSRDTGFEPTFIDASGLGADSGSKDGSASVPDAKAVDASMLEADTGTGPECTTHKECPENEYCESGICVTCPASDDCNSNGVSDYCDIVYETSSDCNENKLPDECDLVTLSLDCNQNAVLDECEFIDDGCVTEGRQAYVEYIAGNIPVIVSAPHGGTLEPAEIAPRQAGTQVRDTNTTELARNFYYRMQDRVGAQPHLILVHLNRNRLDANRAMVEATELSAPAVTAWEEYHKYIAAAKRSVVRNFGSGLYLDFHGLRASRTKIEIGYLLSGSQLEIPDPRMRHPGYARLSSLYGLSEQTDASFEELLRGANSFGTLLTNASYDSVPSTQYPDPGRDSSNNRNAYFSGGYNTFKHGSVQGGFISGIQLEHVWEGVRDSLSNRRAYCTALAGVTETYLAEHFGLSLYARSLVQPESAYVELSENEASKEIMFIRRGDLSQRVTLELEYSGTATLAEDFLSLPTSVIFAAGSDQASLEIRPRDDGDIEGPNTLNIFVRTSTQYHFVLNSDWSKRREVLVALHDDERPSIEVRTQARSFSEPSDSIQLLVSSVPGGAAGDVSLEVAGTAEHGDDYLMSPAPIGSDNRISVSLSPASPVSRIDVQVQDDNLTEGQELVVIKPISSQAFSAPLFSPSFSLDDDDDDPALLEWWPGTTFNERLLSNLPDVSLPILLPDTRQGPQSVAGPTPLRSALRFDGIDDIAAGSDVVILDETNPQPTEFTLSMWFRLEALPSNSYGYLYSHSSNLFGRFHPASEMVSNSENYLHVYISQSGILKTAIRGTDDENGFSALDSPSPLEVGRWYHYGLVVKRLSGVTSSHVYLDGTEISSATRGGEVFDPIGGIHLGGRYDYSSIRHFHGDLSDIRVYRRALTGNELQNLMSSP